MWNRGDDPIAAFAAHFRSATSRQKKKASDLPLDERIGNYIIEGTKEGLIADLELKLKEAAPLDIINGPLMAGMDEVGRLFNTNELIVAEVLQTAEAMKAAVSYLEQFMEKSADSSRGRIILATVKGDVHDIGKNLVDIILSNNGYQVVNLGIKVPPEVLIQAVREHKPDAIGLSGLAGEVGAADGAHRRRLEGCGHRSAVACRRRGVVGSVHARQRSLRLTAGTVVYANDAMNGLDILNKLMDPQSRAKLEGELLERDLGVVARVAEPVVA